MGTQGVVDTLCRCWWYFGWCCERDLHEWKVGCFVIQIYLPHTQSAPHKPEFEGVWRRCLISEHWLLEAPVVHIMKRFDIRPNGSGGTPVIRTQHRGKTKNHCQMSCPISPMTSTGGKMVKTVDNCFRWIDEQNPCTSIKSHFSKFKRTTMSSPNSPLSYFPKQ